MNGNFNILLGSKLDTSQKTISDINSQINLLSDKLSKINLKINIDSNLLSNITKEFKELGNKLDLNISTGKLSSELDKLTHSYKYLEDGTKQINKVITETTNQHGEQVKLVEKLNSKTKELEKSELHIINNTKQRRQEEEIILKQQEKYWELRRKESVKNITSTPDGVKQINNYYKELEKTLGSVENAQKKVNLSQEKYWASVRNEKLTNMTTKSSELQDLARYYSSLEKTSESANVELIKLKNNATATTNVLKNFGNATHHKQADELTNSLKKLNITQDMTQKEMQETVARAKELSNQLNNVSKEAKATGNNSMTLGNMMSTAFEKFSVWIGITSLFFGAIRAIKSGTREVIELNTAQTELNKVLDIGTEAITNYTEKAYKMGRTLGRTGKDVLLATSEFARAGYNLQESAQLAEDALLLTNVADGLEDTAEAAGYLIAVLKGYKLEAKDTTHVVDLLNEVSNNYAVNTVKLAEGLQRTAGTLSQTGTSMEELAGILTGGFEVLRNMEKVSSGKPQGKPRMYGNVHRTQP